MKALVLSYYKTDKNDQLKHNFSFCELKEGRPHGKPFFTSQKTIPECKDVLPFDSCFLCDMSFGPTKEWKNFKTGQVFTFQNIDSISSVKVVKLG